MSKMKTFKIGDRVKYTREFCRNTGQITGDTPRDRGIVTEIKKYSDSFVLVTVEWQLDSPGKVAAANLTLTSDPERV